MNTHFQSDTFASGSSGAMAAYPQTSTTLSPRLANFQMMQPQSGDLHSLDSRSIPINKSQNDITGTPLRPLNSSNVGMGQGSDISSSSPYRIITGGSQNGLGSMTPPQSIPSGLPPVSTTVPTNLSSIPGLQNNPTIIRTEGNVVYSTQPLSAADFGQVMGGTFQTQSGQAQVNMSSSNGFSQFQSFAPMPQMPFQQMSTGFMSASPMTPRLMGPIQPLTPRGFPQVQYSTGQVGLTPRSYQNEQIMSSSIIPAPQPVDPMMMMFAETFRNQCIAMQQYYASHPDELVDSPKSSASIGREGSTAFRSSEVRRPKMQSSLKSIPDQENYDTSNRTPSPNSEAAIKKRDENDVVDILNRLVGDEQANKEAEAKIVSPPTEVQEPVVYYESPVIRRRPESGFESFLKKFGCGQRA